MEKGDIARIDNCTTEPSGPMTDVDLRMSPFFPRTGVAGRDGAALNRDRSAGDGEPEADSAAHWTAVPVARTSADRSDPID